MYDMAHLYAVVYCVFMLESESAFNAQSRSVRTDCNAAQPHISSETNTHRLYDHQI